MVIFLDIDGVLNTKSDWQRPYALNEKCLKEFGKRYKNEKVVLTSSWRTGWSADTKLCTPQISNLIAKLRVFNIEIIGKTEQSNSSNRSREIQRYIDQHNVSNYIIIDDDIDEFKTPIDNLYLTNYINGYNKKELKKYVPNA